MINVKLSNLQILHKEMEIIQCCPQKTRHSEEITSSKHDFIWNANVCIN